MKKGLLLFCLFSFYATIVFASTIDDNFFKLDSYLKKGKFISESEFFIVGSNGYVMYSPDNGNYWERKLTYSQEFLVSLEFVQFSKTLFVIGQNGTLLKSTNKGNNWEKVNINSKSNLYSISFSDNFGIITGDSGIVLISHDYGENWTTEPKFSDGLLKHSIIINDEIFIVDNSSIIYRKKINESEWKIQNKNGEIIPNEISIKILNYKNKIFLLTRNNLLVNSDNSENWIVKNIGWKNQSNMFIFVENELSIILPSIGGDAHNFFTVLKVDLNNFESELVPYIPSFSSDFRISRSYIEDIFFNNYKNQFFAIGMNGTIMKLDQEKEIWNYLSHYGYNNSDFKPITFVNDSIGYIGRFEGIVLKTANFGNTILSQKDKNKVPDEGNTNAIISLNELEALRVVNTPLYPLSRTTDGGISYVQIDFRPYFDSPRFDFRNNKFVVCGVGQKAISSGYISTVENYTTILTSNKFDSCAFLKPKYLSENEIIVCGSKRIKDYKMDSTGKVIDYGLKNALINRSIDYGNTWNIKLFENYSQFYGIYFLNQNEGFAFAEYIENDLNNIQCLLRTTDSGEHWGIVLDSLDFPLIDININKETGYGILLGRLGNLWETNDFGKSWIEVFGRTNEQYESFSKFAYIGKELYITSSLHIYRAYPGKFPPNPVSVIEKSESGAPPIWLYPPFPNPTKSDINFKLLWSKQITLENVKFGLYDILGNEVENFPNISAVYELENLATINLMVQNKLHGLYYLRANVDGYYKTFPIVFE